MLTAEPCADRVHVRPDVVARVIIAGAVTEDDVYRNLAFLVMVCDFIIRCTVDRVLLDVMAHGLDVDGVTDRVIWLDQFEECVHSVWVVEELMLWDLVPRLDVVDLMQFVVDFGFE